jgi:hypothetical protein
MRVSIVKAWIKAVGMACVVELLCVIPLAMAIARGQPANGKFVDGFLNFLSLYHMFAITLAFSVLNIIWAWHGPAGQPIATPNSLLYVLIYVFQLILTTPIIYGLIRLLARVRAHRKQT